MRDFSLKNITLKDAYLLNARELETMYLESLDEARFLRGFSDIANQSNGQPYYDGWEHSSIQGHTMGHYMTALAKMYEGTGNELLLNKMNHIVEQLATYQDDNGYVAAIPQSHYLQIEEGNTSGTWVPWYTMHKILAGLIDIYKVTDNALCKEVMSKLGDWISSRTSQWGEEKQRVVLSVEYGGMNDALYELYHITGKINHMEAAHAFDELSLFEKLYRKEDCLNGLHANTTIPKIIGALKRYIVSENQKEEEFYLQVAKNFWDIVVENHTYITGGNSEWEHFGQSRILDEERTNANCETCNTYNMLKLSRELFKITKDVKYMDYYENTFYNAILSSQNPKTGMTTYFQPMATGFYKVYSSREKHFWCCTGSGMENFSKLGDSIYYQEGDSLYITSYFSSDIHWAEKGFLLSVEADLLKQGKVTATVEKITEPGVKLVFRVPEWCKKQFTVRVNGEILSIEGKDGFFVLDREWKEKDSIDIEFAMQMQAYGLYDNEYAVAFKYGPIVLSADLGQERMEDSVTGVDVTVPTRLIEIDENIMISKGISRKEWLHSLEHHLVKEGEDLKFVLKDTNRDLVFSPHFMQHEKRYGIYFYLFEEGCEAAKKLEQDLVMKKDMEDRTIDRVPVSNDQYELSHHMLTEKSTSGSFEGLMYRDALETGFFQYDMKVDPEKGNELIVKYYSENAGRTFSIYVDNQLLEKVLLMPRKRGFYEMTYKIPKEYTQGKQQVTVKFAADVQGFAGGIFDHLRMLVEL